MSLQRENTYVVDDFVKWEAVDGNSFKADDISFSNPATLWTLRAYTNRGIIGKSTALWLFIPGASDQPLNGTFKLDDSLEPHENARMFILEEFQEDWFYSYAATGEVQFEINPDGVSTGQIDAELQFGLKIKGAFSVTKTSDAAEAGLTVVHNDARSATAPAVLKKA